MDYNIEFLEPLEFSELREELPEIYDNEKIYFQSFSNLNKDFDNSFGEDWELDYCGEGDFFYSDDYNSTYFHSICFTSDEIVSTESLIKLMNVIHSQEHRWAISLILDYDNGEDEHIMGELLLLKKKIYINLKYPKDNYNKILSGMC